MTLAPNETQENYDRKQVLMSKMDLKTITDEELLELRELARIAVSHMSSNSLTN